MAAHPYVLFTSPPSCLNIWASDGVQEYTFRNAIIKVTVGPDYSRLLLWAEEGSSILTACIDSFNQVIRVNGTAIALCNRSGGICISFENETTLKDFVKSLRTALPCMAQPGDLEECIDADATSTTEDMMDSFLFEMSSALLDDISDLMVNSDGDVPTDLFDWDIVDV